MKETKLFEFLLKMLPYIKYDNKKNYYKDICNYFTKIDTGFKKFIIYYDKNWINTQFINFDCISQNEYYFRTNNYIENFHRLLNDTLINLKILL